ncbi:MAG: hypothetical protein MRY78_15520 [Saprospiraceae bacterium]|nr:hypothetical protein [Saprospiraceae bacterium]
MKYWINEKGNDKVIVINDQVIYNNNPRKSKIYEIHDQLRKGFIPFTLTGTAFRYISKIVSNSKSNKLTIYYGEKNKVEIDAQGNKAQIIQYLKNDPVNKPIYQEFPEKWYRIIGKPLLAIAVIGLITAYTYQLAINIERGYIYEISSDRGIGMMLLGLAEILGSTKVLAIGIALSIIIFYSVISRIISKRTIQQLTYRKK